MSKIITILFGIFFSVFSSANSGLNSSKIFFPAGVTKLTKSVINQASDIYNNLSERNFTRVKFIALGEENHTSIIRNQLAKKRAFSIRDFFIRIGCIEQNVKIDYSGTPHLILFKPKAKYSVTGQINLSKIEQQCFTINPSQNSFYQTKEGNFFVFEPNSFETEYGFSVTADVVVCIWEFYKKKDMIKGQLSSSTENNFLETASTFYIQAYRGDDKVELKKNKSFKIYMNRIHDTDGFRAFYGYVKEGNLRWVEDKKSMAYLSMFDERELSESINKKHDSFRVREIKKYKEERMQKKLFLSGKKIGWINCDRIIKTDHHGDIDVVINAVNEEFTVRLILSRKNTIIPGLANSNSINLYKLSKLPVGESGYILAYKESRDGYMIAYSQVTIGFVKSINLNPEYKTKEEFEDLIDSFLI